MTIFALYIWINQALGRITYESINLSHHHLRNFFFVFWSRLFCVEENESGIWKIRPAHLPKIDRGTATFGWIGATRWFDLFHYPTVFCCFGVINFDVFGLFGTAENKGWHSTFHPFPSLRFVECVYLLPTILNFLLAAFIKMGKRCTNTSTETRMLGTTF